MTIAEIATTTIRVRIVNRGRRSHMVGASMGVTEKVIFGPGFTPQT
jgi:hypothetical protein